jgi:peptidoglycan/xylan/chitin deacetylase (PgdA/CDA1 family)
MLIVKLSAELGVRDPATESQFDYGSRAAIWRVMRSFEKHNIPITFYAVARAFERNPAVAKYAEEKGHEVASHCYKVSELACKISL